MSRSAQRFRGLVGGLGILAFFGWLTFFFAQRLVPGAELGAWSMAAIGLIGGAGLGAGLVYLDDQARGRFDSERVQLLILVLGSASIPFAMGYLSTPIKMLLSATVGSLAAVVFALSWSPSLIASQQRRYR